MLKNANSLCFLLAVTCQIVQSSEENSTGGEERLPWYTSLFWNLLGYATLIIPGAVIIYLVKNSNLKEAAGEGFVFKCLQLCIFGKPLDKKSLEEGSAIIEVERTASLKKTAFNLVFCAAGLQMSYLTWGVLQERVMTQEYEEHAEDATVSREKFDDSQFLVFVNRALALLVSGVYIMTSNQPQHTAPLYKYSYSSFSNIMSSWCQYEALKFISFPTQVICKASKMIPVMIMGKVVSGKTYPYHEYLVAVLLSLGTTIFLLSQETGHSKTGEQTTVVGLIILIGYMAFDSFTSNWQSELFKQHKMSSVQMMFGANLFSSLFTLCSLLQTGGFYKSVVFALKHHGFMKDIVILSCTSAIGQLFIFYTISAFGPVVFVIIMTVRLVLSIVLSCIIYQHSMAWQSLFGVIIVFSAISMRIYYRYKARKETDNKQPK